MITITQGRAEEHIRSVLMAYKNEIEKINKPEDLPYLEKEGQEIVNDYNTMGISAAITDAVMNKNFFKGFYKNDIINLANRCRWLVSALEIDMSGSYFYCREKIGRIIDKDIGEMEFSEKIMTAISYSELSNEVLEELGDLNVLAAQMAVVAVAMVALTATGYGAVAEALGLVLLVVGASVSGTNLLKGIIELVNFFIKVGNANSEEGLRECGKLFGDAIAKLSVDGLFFVLSMFGLKKASAKLTTRTVVDNGLNANKWKGKSIKEKRINIDESTKNSNARPSWRKSEVDVAKDYPDYTEQKSFIGRKEVPYGSKGSVRPDLYSEGKSIDVKNYNLSTATGRRNLVKNIEKQYNQRVLNLPSPTKQTIIIDIRGQTISNDVLTELYQDLQKCTNNNINIMFKNR